MTELHKLDIPPEAQKKGPVRADELTLWDVLTSGARKALRWSKLTGKSFSAWSLMMMVPVRVRSESKQQYIFVMRITLTVARVIDGGHSDDAAE